MTGFLSRIAAAALLIALLPAAPAGSEPGGHLELTPTRALRLASAPPRGPEIPGVTYPHKAPPDLLAREPDEADGSSLPEPDAIAEAPAPTPSLPVARDAIDSGSDTAAVSQPSEPASPTTDASAPRTVRETTLHLHVDLATQRLTVTERGAVKHVWPISSGRAPHVTPVGTFRPQWASRMWYSRQYEMAPMPHAIFFNRGVAFHATQATHLLGRPASHGCVRLAPQNARALFALVHAHGYAATEIVVAGAPQVAADKRKSRPARVTGSQPPPQGFWPFF